MEYIAIDTEFIKLAQFLKFSNAVSSGSDAKHFIQDGNVKVNGEVCTMRGKKIYDGDTVEFEGKVYKAVKA
ncbi:MAG: S4 domain-containing protein YaaA [Firmicutes bacterium]|nr:S4 domain-containing protein YaaA [Bacillota bacterium]